MAHDADLTFRVAGDGNFTADEAGTTHIIDLGPGGTGPHGVEVWCQIPQASGTDTLQLTVQHDEDSALGSVDHSATFPLITSGTTYTTTGKFIQRVWSTRRYIGLDFNVTDTGGGVNFGAVLAGIKFGSALRGGASAAGLRLRQPGVRRARARSR